MLLLTVAVYTEEEQDSEVQGTLEVFHVEAPMAIEGSEGVVCN
jgi:hypothetical protein